jgi:CRP/FNR family transcriptional regulator, cyclic AMP receptor protein
MIRGAPRHVIEMLRTVPLFQGASTTELRSIARLGTRIRVHPGTALTTQGRRGSECFLVMSGTATCVVDGEQVAQFGSGDFFGELALLGHTPRTATVTAETDMDVVVFSETEFRTLLHDSDPVARQMLGRLADRVHTLELSEAG